MYDCVVCVFVYIYIYIYMCVCVFVYTCVCVKREGSIGPSSFTDALTASKRLHT